MPALPFAMSAEVGFFGGKTLQGAQEVRGTGAASCPKGDGRMLQRLHKIHYVLRGDAYHCASGGIKTHGATPRQFNLGESFCRSDIFFP